MRIERAKWPYIGCAVKASTEAAEPDQRPSCLVKAAQAREGQRHNTVASLLSALKYRLVVGAGPPTLQTASRHCCCSGIWGIGKGTGFSPNPLSSHRFRGGGRSNSRREGSPPWRIARVVPFRQPHGDCGHIWTQEPRQSSVQAKTFGGLPAAGR